MSTAALVAEGLRFCVVRGSATDEEVAALAGVFAALATSDLVEASAGDQSRCRLVGSGPRRPWRRARTREPLRSVRRDRLQLNGSSPAVRTAAARWAAQR